MLRIIWLVSFATLTYSIVNLCGFVGLLIAGVYIYSDHFLKGRPQEEVECPTPVKKIGFIKIQI